MKTKLFLSFLFITLVFFYSCDENNYPSPKNGNEKNLKVKLENIPNPAKGKDGVLFVFKGEELYLTQSFSLENDNMVSAYLPQKETYEITAFIKKENEEWNPNDQDNNGWYSSAANKSINAANPQLNLLTKEWTLGENIDSLEKTGMTYYINCDITSPSKGEEFTTGDIIKTKITIGEKAHINISRVTLYMNGDEITTMTEPDYYHDINTKNFELGKHTIRAEAQIEDEFIAADEVEIYIEPEDLGKAPEININKPEAEVTHGDTVMISADIYDPDSDGEIISAELFVDDQKLAFTDTTGNTYMRNWGTVDYETGSHEIKIVAKDDNENVRTKKKNVTLID